MDMKKNGIARPSQGRKTKSGPILRNVYVHQPPNKGMAGPDTPTVLYRRDIITDDSAHHKVELEFVDFEGRIRSLLRPRAELREAKKVLSALLDSGVRDDAQLTEQNLKQVLSAPPQDAKAMHLTRTLGWHESGDYVFKTNTFSSEPTPRVLHEDAVLGASVKNWANKLSVWQRRIGTLCRNSNFAVFAVGVGLAGPFLRFGQEGVGIAFNLSGFSGRGKTAALCLAQSVSERATYLDLPTLNVTPTFFEEKGAECRDGCVVFDEFGSLQGGTSECREVIRAMAFKVRDGRGRGRSKSGAVAVGQSELRFRVSVMTTSEKPLVVLSNGTRVAGEEVRYIDVSVPRADTGILDSIVNDRYYDKAKRSGMLGRCAKRLSQDYGQPIRYLVWHIIRDQSAERQFTNSLERFQAIISAKYPDLQSRYVNAFGTVYATLCFASAKGVVPFDQDRVQEAMLAIFERSELVMRLHRGAADDEVKDTIIKLQADLRDKSKAPLIKKGEHKGAAVVDRWAIRREVSGIMQAVLDPDALCNRFGANKVERLERYLLQWEVQMPDTSGKPRQQVEGTGMKKVKRPRFIVLDLDAFAALSLGKD
ncbi:DUF927 domain-containing protein [Pelagibacterium montanilacus]|uniref:DUF927 domain-containing protein n=1 Tax=Pelagibacterium montanilacus TaxID=2185280 RepID=UPI000F8D4DB9|nr:DUF927 domain-containing protein [Pelagibacterium montanilacus]